MKPKTARRILKKRAWERAALNTGASVRGKRRPSGNRGLSWDELNTCASVRGKRWWRRLEAKCLRVVAEDKMDKAFGGRTCA